jgi:hypothetical protein
MSRREEVRERFRPAPPYLRASRNRARYREYARFYGLYVNRAGKRNRFSFSVRVNPRLTNAEKYRYYVSVCNALLSEEIPEHRQGDIFDSFRELLWRTNWFRVRRLVEYKAGAVYER